MRATKLFLLLAIATVMACEPGDSTCLHEEPSTAEEYSNADESMDDSTDPIVPSDEPVPESIDDSYTEPMDETEPEALDEPDPDPMEEDASEATEAPVDSPEVVADLNCDTADAPDWIRVNIEAHRLIAAPLLISHWTPHEVELQLEQVNALWAQACIRFHLSGFGDTKATPEGEAAFSNSAYHEGWAVEALNGLIYLQGFSGPHVKLYLYGEFGPPGSGYYSWELGAVFLATGPPIANLPIWYEPVILAHELGHALGLTDYDGPDAEANIMGLPDYSDLVGDTLTVPWGGSGALHAVTELTPEQIATARAQAATGGPVCQHEDAWN